MESEGQSEGSGLKTTSTGSASRRSSVSIALFLPGVGMTASAQSILVAKSTAASSSSPSLAAEFLLLSMDRIEVHARMERSSLKWLSYAASAKCEMSAAGATKAASIRDDPVAGALNKRV